MIKLSLCALTLALAFAQAPLASEATSGTIRPAATKPPPSAVEHDQRARNYFTDLPVVTHEGKSLRFYSDVLKDRVVLVTFFYTNCKGMCPIVNAALSKVQNLLGDRIGNDVFLISITVDPEMDAPEVLADYREKFSAGDGWIFLTGEKENIDNVTYRMGQTFPVEAHSPYIVIGNVKRARWQRLRPNMPPVAIAAHLRRLAERSSKS